jgi:hypothetical protein
MEEKIKGWIPTCERFVAFLDIMGFKDMVFRDHVEVLEKLLSFQPKINIVQKKSHLDLKTVFGDSEIRPVIFSDSILLVSSDGSPESAHNIMFSIEWIFRAAMILEIPIKGAIAYGQQTAIKEKSIYFGIPLIDAFELQEELQLYGIVLHHTMENRLRQIGLIEALQEGRDLVKTQIPMKSGKIIHYVVDCMSLYDKKDELVNQISKLYNNVSGKPRLYVDNTLEFVREIQKRDAELAQKNQILTPFRV